MILELSLEGGEGGGGREISPSTPHEFYFFFFTFIGVELTYNVLVSGYSKVNQSFI